MILLWLTDYNDDLMYHFFHFLACILSLFAWMFLTTHATVCVCNAELKCYILMYTKHSHITMGQSLLISVYVGLYHLWLGGVRVSIR